MGLKGITNVEVRYLIYSEGKGVYLGKCEDKHRWSKESPGTLDTAPTFVYGDATGLVAEFKSAGEAQLCQIHECWPDKADFRASKDSVANATLPRW